MVSSGVSFESVSFAYEGASLPLFQGLTARFPAGWTGIIGANGAGKTTILLLATGMLKPTSGCVRTWGRAVYCPQRTENPPPRFGDLIRASDPDAFELKGILGVQGDWLTRWDTLSHGERKRGQIAVALWLHPQVLAIDEPTNHIDADARLLLTHSLRAFKGSGLMVSHDRELLDSMCTQCLFVEPPAAVLRAGGYTDGSREAQREDERRRHERKRARIVFERLRREVIRRREKASRADRERSKRGLALHDHDARVKKDMARITGKDGQAGRLTRQLEGRLEQAEDVLEGSKVRKTYRLGIWIPGVRSHRDCVFQLPAGEIALGPDRKLRFPGLRMCPEDRIALTGPNGMGKTTLVALIIDSLNLPRDKVTYMPQEIDLRTSTELVREVRSLKDEMLGRVMTVVSCLNSRPRRILETEEPSPGEVRKLLLALGIAHGPHLIVMDEPTNHLDLPSVECLEAALAGCPCALFLVSHDNRFLDRLTTIRWRMAPDEKGARLLMER